MHNREGEGCTHMYTGFTLVLIIKGFLFKLTSSYFMVIYHWSQCLFLVQLECFFLLMLRYLFNFCKSEMIILFFEVHIVAFVALNEHNFLFLSFFLDTLVQLQQVD